MKSIILDLVLVNKDNIINEINRDNNKIDEAKFMTKKSYNFAKFRILKVTKPSFKSELLIFRTRLTFARLF